MRLRFCLLLAALLTSVAGCGNNPDPTSGEIENKTKVAPKTKLYFDPHEKLPQDGAP